MFLCGEPKEGLKSGSESGRKEVEMTRSLQKSRKPWDSGKMPSVMGAG
jgi:hypothetical protein